MIGCGIDVSPDWARVSVPGFASSSIQTDADMTPRVENSHTLRVNPSDMSLRWLAIASDKATPPTQPITPDSSVVVHERRTPSSRPTSQAMTSTPGSDSRTARSMRSRSCSAPRIIVPSVVEASGSPQPSSSTVSS